MESTPTLVIGGYTILKRLGSGCHSKVYLAEKKGVQYAMKVFDKSTAAMNKRIKEEFYVEVRTMLQLDHPNILKLIEYHYEEVLKESTGESAPEACIVFELAQGGDLFDFIKKTGAFSHKLARHYFHQLVSALEHVHKRGFAHRDLKPENVLLDEHCELLLADFGFTCSMKGPDGTGKLGEALGTAAYMAPELHQNKAYSGEKVDIFALGVILFIMIAHTPPFGTATEGDINYCRLCYDNERYWSMVARVTPAGTVTADFKNLINSLLSYNPDKRLSINEMKDHPWYKSALLSPEELATELMFRKYKAKSSTGSK